MSETFIVDIYELGYASANALGPGGKQFVLSSFPTGPQNMTTPISAPRTALMKATLKELIIRNFGGLRKAMSGSVVNFFQKLNASTSLVEMQKLCKEYGIAPNNMGLLNVMTSTGVVNPAVKPFVGVSCTGQILPGTVLDIQVVENKEFFTILKVNKATTNGEVFEYDDFYVAGIDDASVNNTVDSPKVAIKREDDKLVPYIQMILRNTSPNTDFPGKHAIAGGGFVGSDITEKEKNDLESRVLKQFGDAGVSDLIALFAALETQQEGAPRNAFTVLKAITAYLLGADPRFLSPHVATIVPCFLGFFLNTPEVADATDKDEVKSTDFRPAKYFLDNREELAFPHHYEIIVVTCAMIREKFMRDIQAAEAQYGCTYEHPCTLEQEEAAFASFGLNREEVVSHL